MGNLMVFLLYSIALILVIYYFYTKFKIREYIFSFYTITILIFTFTLFIIGPFQYKLEAWSALGIFEMDRVIKLFPYINKIYVTNLIGFSVFIISLMYFEFKDNNNKIYFFIKKNSLEININVLRGLFYLSVISWYIITLSINKTLPILNHNRLFIEEYGLLKPIYLGLNSIIILCGTLFIIRCINNVTRLDIFSVTIALVTILATGNRGPLIGILTTSIIYAMYLYVKNKKVIVVVVVVALLCCALFGFVLEFLRGSSIDNNLITNIIYGNTFSDIRDGAFVLEAYEAKYEGYLWGKNYIADAISFIPASMSEFRTEWSYGHFTTSTLFGWSNHYGLRGGWFLEPYINFSMLGVIIIAIIYAYYTAGVEHFFFKNIVNKKPVDNVVNALVIISVVGIGFSSLTTSSGFNAIYANFTFVLANILITKFIKKINKVK